MGSARNHDRSNGNNNNRGRSKAAVAEILEKWKDINSSSKPKRAPLPARRGCKKGCMRGKGGPQNLDCKFRGVRQRVSGKWVAEIREPNGGRLLWLGTFPTAIQAALAYDEASKVMYGLPERLNFPPQSADFSTPPEEESTMTTTSSNSNCSDEFVGGGTNTSQMEEYLSPKVAPFLPFHKETTLQSLVYDEASIAMYASSALLYLPPHSVADSSSSAAAASTPPEESTMTTSSSNSNCSDDFVRVRCGTNTRQMEEKANEYLSPKVAPFLPPLMQHSISMEAQAVNTPGFKGTYIEKHTVLEAETADDNNSFQCAPKQDDLLLQDYVVDEMFDVDEFLLELQTGPIVQPCEQEWSLANPLHESGFDFSSDEAWQDHLVFLH